MSFKNRAKKILYFLFCAVVVPQISLQNAWGANVSNIWPCYQGTQDDRDYLDGLKIIISEAPKIEAKLVDYAEKFLKENYTKEQLEKYAKDNVGVGVPGGNITQYRVVGQKTPYVFVYVHGLYATGSDDQFKDFIESHGFENNQISITLPGHGADVFNGNEVTANMWVDEVKKQLKIARKLGKEVVFIGQSTGGMLGIIAGIENPELVDKLILVEPAVKVQDKLVAATCLGKYFVKDARSFGFLSKLAGADVSNSPVPTSTSMGCEVDSLRARLVDKYLGGSGGKGRKETYDDSFALGKMLKVPTAVINNTNDTVVDHHHNQLFAMGVAEATQGAGGYLETGSGGTHHGVGTVGQINRFLVGDTGTSFKGLAADLKKSYIKGLKLNYLNTYKNTLEKLLAVNPDSNSDEDVLKLFESIRYFLIDGGGVFKMASTREVVTFGLSDAASSQQPAKGFEFLKDLNENIFLDLQLIALFFGSSYADIFYPPPLDKNYIAFLYRINPTFSKKVNDFRVKIKMNRDTFLRHQEIVKAELLKLEKTSNIATSNQ